MFRSIFRNLSAAIALGCFMLAPVAVAAPPESASGQGCRVVVPKEDGVWNVNFTPVPKLLRMHLPMLPENVGLYVESIDAQSEAAKLGLHAGDVLLEVDGVPVQIGMALPKLTPSTRAVSLQRGEVFQISMPQDCIFPLPDNAGDAAEHLKPMMQHALKQAMHQIMNTELPAEAKRRAIYSLGGTR